MILKDQHFFKLVSGHTQGQKIFYNNSKTLLVFFIVLIFTQML